MKFQYYFSIISVFKQLDGGYNGGNMVVKCYWLI